jgi:integrase
MTTTTVQPSAETGRRSPFSGADVCHEAGLAVRPAGRGPCFDDEVWDFTGVQGLPRILPESAKRWDFAKIGNPAWRLVAKEYVLALLAPGHPRVRTIAAAYRVPRTLGTCALRVAEVTRWLNWLSGQHLSRLGEVSDRHCLRYLADRRFQRDETGKLVRELTTGRHLQIATPVIDLAHYGELFTADRYTAGFLPWGGKTATTVVGYRRSKDNKTLVVPQPVLQPMLAAALFTVQIIGPRLVAARQQMTQRRLAEPEAHLQVMSDTLHLMIDQALRGHLERRDPLIEVPASDVRTRLRSGWNPDDPLLKVNFSALAHDAGLSEFKPSWIPRLRPELADAVARVGLAPPWARRAEQVTRADGTGQVPWSLPLFWLELRHLTGFTQTACALLIAAVSGMRASELMELRVGCRRPPEQALPGLNRYRLASTITKGQPLGGAPEEWIVIEEAYRAAELAEELLADGPADAPLFPRSTFSQRYASFRAWVNGPEGRRLGLAAIPDQDVNLRMLRRTLSRELAYRPHGLLAAKVQLKHISAVTSEGYAARPGGAQGKLLAEIGEHEQERNLELVLAEYRNYQQDIMPSGPGAKDLVEYFTSVDHNLAVASQSSPKTAASDQELRGLLAKRAGSLHLGTANYCWFTDPSRALCLKLARTPNAGKPMIGMCDSARCPQATHHPCHRPVWADTANNTKTFLGNLSRGQKPEKTRLNAELARAERVIAQIDAAAAATPAQD